MQDRVEVLDDDAAGRPRRTLAVGAALALAVVAGGGAVRSTVPPPPLDIGLAALQGTALVGDSFVRLHLELEGRGVRDLGEVRLTVAGTTGLGLHPAVFDDDGRMTVQVDVTPACPAVPADVAPGTLELDLRDERGQARSVRLDVPTAGPLERLVRYRCRDA